MNQKQLFAVNFKDADKVAYKYSVPNMYHEVYSCALRSFSGRIPYPVDSIQDMDETKGTDSAYMHNIGHVIRTKGAGINKLSAITTMKKKIEEYIAGDVIRGTFNVKGVRKKNRKHCFIILNNARPISEKKSHIPCVPSCSFSSETPKVDDRPFLDLCHYNLPDDFFQSKKPVSYLRFAEPHCLKRFEVKKHIGNLKEYGTLWEDLCVLMHSNFPQQIDLLEEVCSCDCLEDQNINVGFCEQDNCDFDTACNAICSCCGNLLDETNHFTSCPNCNDNVFVSIVDQSGQILNHLYPE